MDVRDDKKVGFKEELSRGKAQTIKALRQPDKVCRSLIEHTSDVIVTMTEDGTIQYMNRSVTGRAVEKSIGTKIYEYVPLECHDSIRNTLKQVFATGNSGMYETIALGVGPNGQSWYSTQVSPFFSDGEVVGATLVATDINHHKQLEEALRMERDNFASIFNSMPDVVYITDGQHNITYINNSFKKEFGEVNGKKCYEILNDPKGVCPWCKINSPEAYTTFRTQFYSDKVGKFFDVVAVPLKHQKDTQYHLKILRDITTSKQIEEMQRQSEKLAATGRMAAGIAHEINNPLAGIKNSFLLVKEGIDKEHVYYKYVPKIEKEIDRISRIVKQMFDLYRPEHETATSFFVDDIVSDVVTLLEIESRQHEITIDFEKPSKQVKVCLEKSVLIQVLFNILKNAIEASPTGGTVLATIKASREHLSISISDQGSGIDKEISSRIFEPFFTTKTDIERRGVGLGLSASLTFVKSMGGKLEFENQIDGGALFEIELPLKTDRNEIQNV